MLRIFPVGSKLCVMAGGFCETFRRGKAVLSFVHIQSIEGKLFLFTYQPASFQCHFKTVGAGRISRGCHKYAGRSAGELQICCNIIFNFHVMPLSDMAESLHPGRHSANPL